jgi:hypothetical protein
MNTVIVMAHPSGWRAHYAAKRGGHASVAK